MLKLLKFLLIFLFPSLIFATHSLQLSAAAPDPNPATTTEQAPDPQLQDRLYSDQTIGNWAKDAALFPFNFNYENYEEIVHSASTLFSEKAWTAFKPDMLRFRTPEYFIKYKGRVTARLNGRVDILQQGLLKGIYTWKVIVPIQIYYHDAFKSRRQTLQSTLVIQRADPHAYKDALVVVQYITTIQSVVEQPGKARLVANNVKR